MIYINANPGSVFLAIHLLLRWIHDHGRTQAVIPLGSDQDIVIGTGFTSLPEFIIIGQLGKGHGLIPHSAIDLHACQTGGQTEQPGSGKQAG